MARRGVRHGRGRDRAGLPQSRAVRHFVPGRALRVGRGEVAGERSLGGVKSQNRGRAHALADHDVGQLPAGGRGLLRIVWGGRHVRETATEQVRLGQAAFDVAQTKARRGICQ